MFNLFSSSNDGHITSSLSTSTILNKELINSISSVLDKRVKIYHSQCTKLKQLSYSIPTNLLADSKIKKQENTKYPYVFEGYQAQKYNLLYFSEQSNKALKRLLKNIQESLIKQSNNLMSITNKMQKKFIEQVNVMLSSLVNESKNMINIQKNLQKQYEAGKQMVEKIKNKYHSQWAKLQNLQIDYILSISQDNSEKQNSQKKKILQIQRLDKEVTNLQSNYLQQNDKQRKLTVRFEDQVYHFRKKYQTNQQKKISRLKGLCTSLSLISVQYANQILAQCEADVSSFDLVTIQEIKQIDLLPLQYKKSSQIVDQSDNHVSQYSNCYISNLRKRISNKQTQELILYGVSKEHKEMIDKCLNPEIDFSLDEGKDQKKLKIINVVRLFQRMFSEDKDKYLENEEGQQQKREDFVKGDFNTRLLSEFVLCMESDQIARKNFILCLQKFRLVGKFQLSQKNIPIICLILTEYLNICEQQSDIYNPKKLMVLCLTYYCINNKIEQDSQKREKMYLQHYIKEHRIWKNMKWWQGAFLQTVYEQFYIKQQLKKKKNIIQLEQTIEAQMGNSVQNKKIEQKPIKYSQQKRTCYQNVCLNQIAYFIKNMHLFQIPSAQIKSFFDKYSKTLTNSDKSIILHMIKQFQHQSSR